MRAASRAFAEFEAPRRLRRINLLRLAYPATNQSVVVQLRPYDDGEAADE